MKLIILVFIALNISALAAEPPPLISSAGEHILSDGLRLIIVDRGDGPIQCTVARKYPDQTSAETGYSPLADSGQPFVFCWDLSSRRLWVASQIVVGYINFLRLPSETPKDFSDHGNLTRGAISLPAELVAEMPANFRAATSQWFRVATKVP